MLPESETFVMVVHNGAKHIFSAATATDKNRRLQQVENRTKERLEIET